jgi:YbbR domain-containing protein
MDKLMDKPWFIKILSLVLAVLLYSSVPQTGNKSNDINVPGEQTSATITDIPVKVYYDTENLVVSGIPNTVNMTINGPITHVQSAKTLRNFEVYVDLTNAKIGNQRVKLKVKNLSDKLKATIKPASVNVNVQEKITKEFKVDTEFKSSLLEDGYTAGTPIIEPNRVKITGAKDIIDRVTYVKAILDERNHLKETVTNDAFIRVLDKELNKLNVEVDPGTVKVTIPVKNTSKTVPINVIQKGTPPSGTTIDSVNLDTTEATIMGDEKVLKNTDNVRVEVDVSKISDNTTLTLPIIIGTGITKVSPQTVKATVVVKKTTEKTISGVPVKIRGLAGSYKAVINDPDNQLVNLLVSGPSSIVNALKADDFNVYIDLSNLTDGNHEVNIQVEGPPEVNWKPDKSTAKITINKA